MSKNIWVISDTHFGHENILKFVDSNTGNPVRGHLFKDVDEMDQHMVDKWNETIKPGDLVYHLGDVFFGDREKFKAMWPKLHGSKRLIVGNHDNIPFLASGGFFKKVQMWRQFTEYNLLLSHVPLHETSLTRGAPGVNSKRMLNIHGHIHQNQSPPGLFYNVSVEAIDYTPQHIEDLAAIAKQKMKGNTQ